MLRAGGDAGELGRRLRGEATVVALPAGLSGAEAARAAEQFGELDFSSGFGERFAAAADVPDLACGRY
jgi:hypothetical protein